MFVLTRLYCIRSSSVRTNESILYINSVPLIQYVIHSIPLGRLLDNSPAMRSRQLQLGDMIIQVNGEDVRGMSHHDVVSRIKASSHKIVLTVQETGKY